MHSRYCNLLPEAGAEGVGHPGTAQAQPGVRVTQAASDIYTTRYI
jgi:hypothetical protein